MNKEEFLRKPTESDVDWVTKQVLSSFNIEQVLQLEDYFDKLDVVFDKGKAKNLPFDTILRAVKKASVISRII